MFNFLLLFFVAVGSLSLFAIAGQFHTLMQVIEVTIVNRIREAEVEFPEPIIVPRWNNPQPGETVLLQHGGVVTMQVIEDVAENPDGTFTWAVGDPPAND